MKELIITRQEFFLLTGILLGTDIDNQVFVLMKDGIDIILIFLCRLTDKKFEANENYSLLTKSKFAKLAKYIEEKGIINKSADASILFKELQRHENNL